MLGFVVVVVGIDTVSDEGPDPQIVSVGNERGDLVVQLDEVLPRASQAGRSLLQLTFNEPTHHRKIRRPYATPWTIST